MDFLIVYGTTDGQTAAVAERIADAVQRLGHTAACFDAGQVPSELEPRTFDAILVGASLHAQGYQRRISKFIRRNRDALRSRPSAFFSVCLAIASRGDGSRTAAMKIPRQFVERLGWRPDTIEVIAGAFRFSRYGFVRGAIMRRVASKELGKFDPHQDTELTDWPAVERFAMRFIQQAEHAASQPEPRPSL